MYLSICIIINDTIMFDKARGAKHVTESFNKPLHNQNQKRKYF